MAKATKIEQQVRALAAEQGWEVEDTDYYTAILFASTDTENFERCIWKRDEWDDTRLPQSAVTRQWQDAWDSLSELVRIGWTPSEED